MKKFISFTLAVMMMIGAMFSLTSCGSKFTNLSFKDSAEAFKNGNIDAFFVTAGEPTGAVTDLATTNKFSLLAIDDEHADALIKDYPFYTKHVIKANTYKCVTTDVQTVAVKATMIAANTLSSEQVYQITKALFEEKANIAHAKADFISIDYALSGLGGVPLHAGAARYYAEKLGITVDQLKAQYNVNVAEADANEKTASSIRFTTGGDSGTYYAFGGTIATAINNAAGTSIVPQVSGGSKANVIEIDEGTAEIGWVQNDVMYYAYNGIDLFAGDKSFTSFSVIAAVYPETCQIIGTSDMTSVADLAGKKVSIGDAGSGVEFNARQILAAYGITVK